MKLFFKLHAADITIPLQFQIYHPNRSESTPTNKKNYFFSFSPTHQLGTEKELIFFLSPFLVDKQPRKLNRPPPTLPQ